MSETVIFFGSGPVAAESLRLLAQSFEIEAVITKPRPAHHHGPVPVLSIAEHLGTPLHLASDKGALTALFHTRPFKSRVAILIDFGIIVPQSVIDYFPLGIVNSHFSLLPEWRGPDPITFSILSGQEQTGVSLMILVASMDEGPLIAQGMYRLTPESTTPSLTADLIELSYEMLKEILPKYVDGAIAPYPQDNSKSVTYSRKLTKEDGVLDWHKPAIHLEREIRAFLDWPKSHTTIKGIDMVITKAHVVKATGKAGQTAIIDRNPVVYAGKEALAIDMLKPTGKKEMTGEAFLAGYKKQFLQG
ncbi:MAG TPA: methionyl-tRNA formyltransferase [Candidatus Saccharimonadales bacterium]|nr:methionyl-tRNA formyltransferase [Candidatus Saccharimonadales bacterium]